MNRYLISVVIAVTLVAGCGGANVVGKYKGSLEGTDTDNPMSAALAQSMMGNLSLELKPDKTFTMNMMVPLEGSYTVSGSTLTLNLEKAMGMSVEDMTKDASPSEKADAKKPMVFTIEDGGKKLVAVDKKEGAMVFVKE